MIAHRVVMAVVFGVIVCLSLLLVPILRASGRGDFCFVWGESYNGMPVFILWEHVPWRADRRLGAFSSFDAALDAAKRAECPVGSR